MDAKLRPSMRKLGRINLRSVAGRSRELARRTREGLLLSAVVGVITGLGVALFDTAVTRSLERLSRLPLWAIAVGPFVGIGAQTPVDHQWGLVEKLPAWWCVVAHGQCDTRL